MRKVVALIVPVLLLAACGNEDEIAAKKQTLMKLRARYKSLNQQKLDQSAAWSKANLAVIPAQRDLKSAKSSGNDDAIAVAQAAYDQAQAASQAAIDDKKRLEDQVGELRRKITKLEDAIMRLGGKP